MLTNKEVATLTNKLQVPAVVGDILNGNDTLTDEVQYALHEVISDLQPDSALLAIAVSAAKIAKIYESASPGMRVLRGECLRIIDDYGALWLKNARNENMDGDSVLDILAHAPEDLEGLAELLELGMVFLKAKDTQAAALCEILYIQAGAHAMIADEFIAVANEAAARADTALPAMPALMADNVIPFPVQHRAG